MWSSEPVTSLSVWYDCSYLMLAPLSPAATHWHCQISKPFKKFWKYPPLPPVHFVTLHYAVMYSEGSFKPHLHVLWGTRSVVSMPFLSRLEGQLEWPASCVKPRRASAWPTFSICSSKSVFYIISMFTHDLLMEYGLEMWVAWSFLKSNIESCKVSCGASRPPNMSHTVAFQGFHMDSHWQSLLPTASYTYCMDTDKMFPRTLCIYICMFPNGWRRTSGAVHLLVIRENQV